MSYLFNTPKMIEVLRHYHNVTKIRIAILDTNYNDIVGYPKNRDSICNYIRSCKEADRCCQECDKKACSIVNQTGGFYMYECHAGLHEIIIPLYVNGSIIGYLFFAHLFHGDSREDTLRNIIEKTKRFDLDEEVIKNLCKDSILLSKNYLNSATYLLETLATYICMENLGFFYQPNELIRDIDNYIQQHIQEDISIPKLCRAMGIGKTKLHSLSKQYFNEGIHQHIRKYRINLAKTLLESNDNITIDEVASRCGFTDYNYFIQLFKKMVGITPNKYKKFLHK